MKAYLLRTLWHALCVWATLTFEIILVTLFFVGCYITIRSDVVVTVLTIVFALALVTFDTWIVVRYKLYRNGWVRYDNKNTND